ncbi:DUF4266 domain-containing protein [Mucilaginibacter lappiensis]|uniref:DUF4266 domain-containing protein n=2 Tax=Mucilaginibacter TaxID=423349 RepID=A0A1N6NCI1_9SPHI|nr:DUF4266 domain-containing protein [Mucilaginibacter lappiensis]MBB6108009.1 hypothetical protein [Mucilaginibacter lappiensis]MBB6125919.1 hypothetical protein [Mucilaginibacter lappiensis]SIP89732.1 protein of unknown function [Mucilaginibacter lappiensis]
MKKPLLIKLLLVGSIPALGLSSCSSVKAYQKNRLNDAEMELSARKSQKFEQSFQLYREGASGANGGKSGGGCGCN